MSDGHYDAPAYCDLCDRPINTGPLCLDCMKDIDDDEVSDEWGGMSWHERIEFTMLAIDNGNLTDAANFMMHDGDVRPDSVVLALHVARARILGDPDLTDDADRTVNVVIDRLIRIIQHWETT